MSSYLSSHRFLVGLSGLLLITGPAIGCKKPADAASANAPPRVRFVQPKQANVTDYEYFTGKMDAVDSVEVRARVTGYLKEIYFKDGEEIDKDKDLFLIDQRPYQALVDQAQAQTQLARAKLKIAKADYDRGVAVSKTPGAISVQELETYAAAVASAEASVAASLAAEESADLNLEFTKIKAEIGGLISRPLVTKGNLVVQDNTLLTTIVSQDPMYCYFDIDEQTMLRFQDLIREGKIQSARDGDEKHLQVRKSNDPDGAYPYDGVLDFVENRVSKSSGTLQLRARFDNPQTPGSSLRLFAAGISVEVRLPVGPEHPALLVPQAAIGTDQSQKYVFAISQDNKIEYRPVAVGAVQPGGMQEVIPRKMVRTGEGIRLAEVGEQGEDSITVSDRIVVAGLQRIRQGMVVNPQEYAAPQPPAKPETAAAAESAVPAAASATAK